MGMSILGIDPGTRESGLVVFDFENVKLIEGIILENQNVLEYMRTLNTIFRPSVHAVVFEKVASFGMAVGAEVFETVFWTGRMFEASKRMSFDTDVYRITRIEVKNNICHSSRAKDANIRQALIDRFGIQGTKKNPGPLYGMKSHLWPALAVATTLYDTMSTRKSES